MIMTQSTVQRSDCTLALDERNIIERAKSGDQSAFRAIMELNNRRLYRVARAVMKECPFDLVLRLGCLAPLRRHVLVARGGQGVSSAERGHSRRSEQPDQGTPMHSRQPLLNSGPRVRAATESSNADSTYVRLPGANGLGPPPSAASTINCAYIGILALW
jgi:hypothetical protein